MTILAQAASRGELTNKTTGLNIFSAVLTAVLFLMALLGLVAYLRVRKSGDRVRIVRVLWLVTYGVLAFQAVHTLEHLLQAGYWALHPHSNPWLSPWADSATRGLTTLSDSTGRLQTGTELIHLVGNGVFVLGLICMFIALRDAGARGRKMWGATAALVVETIHVFEHISLTATWFIFGKPYGFSVLFGYAYTLPAPWPPGIRIWWHFLLNLIPMIFALIGLREMYRYKVFDEGTEPEVSVPSRETDAAVV